MAQSTAFRYKGREIDPQAIGRELNVRAVLTGRIVQGGGSLRIWTELVDVATGCQLWGAQYQGRFVLAFKTIDLNNCSLYWTFLFPSYMLTAKCILRKSI